MSAPIVRARGSAFVAFDGCEVRIAIGDEYPADAPIVAAYPSLFAAPVVLAVEYDPPVNEHPVNELPADELPADELPADGPPDELPVADRPAERGDDERTDPEPVTGPVPRRRNRTRTE